MKKPIFNMALLASFLCCTMMCAAQEKPVSLPFELTSHNNWLLKATLNGTDSVTLMLHTAASDVELTKAATQRMKTLVFSRTDTLASWGGSGNTSRVSPDNALKIGSLSWQHMAVFEDLNSGQGSDGKTGLDLFKGNAVRIDFDRQLITIYPGAPDSLQGYQKLKLFAKGSMLFVEAACHIGDSVYTNRYLLHSGYAGDLLLDDQFAADKGLDKQLKIVGEKELKDSYGHVIKVERVLMPALSIGGQTLKDVPAGFFAGAIGRQKMNVIGGDILKRYNWIIDAQREYIYIKANQLTASAYPAS